MTESENIQKYLETELQTTVDYVKYIDFIDQAPAMVDEMETQLDYCKELYDIMEEYKIMVSPDDMNRYLGVSVTLGTLRNIVDRKTEDRGKTVVQFNDQCNKDITSLINDIANIKEKCMDPWLIDIDSDMDDAKQALNKLYIDIMGCQKRAGEYKNYQKQFRV